ncbi:MAG: class I SAM-dependent methyltransferase [Candidatus Omnitrophica bacterium]|nr:class I SAM-dependent methyltransferase [Candidatus Omnitrophota bacterium]
MNNEFSYNYGDLYKNDRFVRMRFHIVKELLSLYVKVGVKILDIGCYDAPLLDVLKKSIKSVDYTGVDADKVALEVALLRGAKVMNVNFELEDLPFDNNSFDIVIMTEILEHLRDPEKLIKKAKDILKSDGLIVISLPNECTLYHRLKVLCGKGIDGTGFAPGYHLHFPTLSQNREFIKKHFKIIKTKYWYHLGLGKFEKFFPEPIYKLLVKIRPSLFARGAIYLCNKEEDNR